MKKFLVVATAIFMLSSCNLNVKAQKVIEQERYNEAEEAGKRTIKSIEQAISLVDGKWDAIEISGLYVRLFNEITYSVEKQGEIEGYKIEEINYSKDMQYFSIKVEPTVYHVVEGDTLSTIAKCKGTTVDNLLKMNPEITDQDLIYSGSTLRIK